MNGGELIGSGLSSLTGRFFLVGYLPNAAAVSYVLVLVWAGAPAPTLDFARSWRTLTHLGTADVIVIALVILVMSLLLHPLQITLVRVLEGHWPPVLRPLSALLVRWQDWVKDRLIDQEALPDNPENSATEKQIRQAGLAGARRRRHFPSRQPLYPTALGNVLAAMEEQAGAGYGWDAVVAWPRLYPLLPERTLRIVDDRRNNLDVSARIAIISGVAAAASAALLSRSGWALLLVLLPAAVGYLAYRGAVHAGLAYGEAVQMAFDLHRFELFTVMHMPLPADRAQEREAASALCDFWRQGSPIALSYRHPK